MALPEEIIREELLLRLPVKSLVRFLSVSKRWNSLISDPDFRQSHLTTISQIPSNDDYVIVNTHNNEPISFHDPYYFISIISRNNLSETRINKLPYPIFSKRMHLVGSINGLVCVACLSELDYHFILWNPTIHRFKKVFPPRRLLDNLDHSDRCLFAFGWDSVLNDYKLVVKLPKSLRCVVYSTNKDSWIEIFVSKHYQNLAVSKSPSTFVKGCPYWSPYKRLVLKFEIKSNDFRFFHFSNSQPYYKLINLNDCLARVEYGDAYHEDEGEYHVDVYLFNEDGKVWSKMYTINSDSRYCPSMCFKYGGEMVLNEKKCLYDHKSKQIKRIAYDEEGKFVNGFSHTPSLVFVKGMKALHGRGLKRSLPS